MPSVTTQKTRRRPSLMIASVAVACLGGLLAGAVFAGADEDAGETSPEKKNPGNVHTGAFDHSPWTTVLSTFVDDRGDVDYQALARDRDVFDRYIRAIEASSPESHPKRFPDREDALAYYINAYNALVFDGVLDRGPEEKSVWSGLISGYSFFVRRDITLGGRETNLKKLEEEVILKKFEDPRVHAALNCASISCPRLRQEAYVPERLDEQLDAAMREWVNDPNHVEVDAENQEVKLNEIFDWFSGDFIGYEKRQGTEDPTQIDYINRFRGENEQIPRDYEISFLDYDKGINAQ